MQDFDFIWWVCEIYFRPFSIVSHIKIFYFFYLHFENDPKNSFYLTHGLKSCKPPRHCRIKLILYCKLAVYSPILHAKFQGSSFFNNEMGSNSKNIHRILGHPVYGSMIEACTISYPVSCLQNVRFVLAVAWSCDPLVVSGKQKKKWSSSIRVYSEWFPMLERRQRIISVKPDHWTL